jgi:hypothetical protein
VLQLGQPNAKFIKLHPVAQLKDLTIHIPPGVTVLGRDGLGHGSQVIRSAAFPPL